MTDKEIIDHHTVYGGEPVTKESVLMEHQKCGGSPLTWEDLKNQHAVYGPVEVHNVKMEGTLEDGLTGIVEGIKKKIS